MGPTKSSFRIFVEQLFHILKYGYCNKFYFLYGFDIKSFRKSSEYVDYTQFMNLRNKLNYSSFSNPIVILRDKSLFGITAEAFGINSPHVVGLITNGIDLYLFDKHTHISLIDYFHHTKCDLFLKVVDGECADGVFHIISDTINITSAGKNLSIEEYVDRLNTDTRYILQERIPEQHMVIASIHPMAINTVRLVTVIDPITHKPTPFSAVLRVGCGNSEVDNWAAGGLSIGINIETGELSKYGFYKPGYGTKVSQHPNSGVVFEGLKVPFLQDAILQAQKFHSLLKGIHSIGWDIAITTNGPCIIEGNDNWEISLMQISNHGLEKEYSKMFIK